MRFDGWNRWGCDIVDMERIWRTVDEMNAGRCVHDECLEDESRSSRAKSVGYGGSVMMHLIR
jgi:hypothetical protein